MSRKVATITGTLLAVAALVSPLGALWWWALRGMSQDVGTAWIFTIPLLAGAAWFLQCFGNTDG